MSQYLALLLILLVTQYSRIQGKRIINRTAELKRNEGLSK